MTQSFPQILIVLLLGISLIVVLTAKLRLHPFFALMIASFVVGLGVQLPVIDVVNTMKEGFGNILRSLGFIILLGTALGVILERNGSTGMMANYILAKIGKRYPALAMSVTGFMVGLPIFCDSGFIVLSGLNSTLAKRTGTPLVIMAVSMATGLYSVHCLIPPHPGAAAAAGIIGVSYGKLIALGILVAIPAMLAAYFYTGYAGKNVAFTTTSEKPDENINDTIVSPSVFNSFLPVILPIILIATKSMLPADLSMAGKVFGVLGDPVIALTVGVLLALVSSKPGKKRKINNW